MEFDGTGYDSLSDAIAAIAASQDKSGTIKVLKDFECEGFAIPSGCAVTLDLNMKTMTATKASTVNGTLFLKGTGGSVVAKAPITVEDGGKLKVNNVIKVVAASDFSGNALIVNRGEFAMLANKTLNLDASSASCFALSCEGGSATCDSNCINGYLEFAGGDFIWEDELDSGCYEGYFRGVSVRAGIENVGSVKLCKSIYSKDWSWVPSDPDGYKWVEDGDYLTLIAAVRDPFEIGENSYKTLGEAIAAAASVTTITTITMVASAESDALTIPTGKTLTIDVKAGKLTLKAPITVEEGAVLTVTGADLCSVEAADDFEGDALFVNKGTLNLNSNKQEDAFAYRGADGVKIATGETGSTFTSLNATFKGVIGLAGSVRLGLAGSSDAGYDNLTFTPVAGFDPSKVTIRTKYAEKVQPPEGYIWDTSAPVDSNYYKLMPDAEAKIGDTSYDTLEEALDEATSGQTVTLLRNLTDADLVVTVPEHVTLTVGFHTLSVKKVVLMRGSVVTTDSEVQNVELGGDFPGYKLTHEDGSYAAAAIKYDIKYYDGGVVVRIVRIGEWEKVFNGTPQYTVEQSVTLEPPTIYWDANKEELVPVIVKDRGDYLFAGWYDNPQLEGDPVTEIPLGSTGAKNFYAKFVLPAATVGGVKYATFGEALAAAQPGETVTLLANQTAPVAQVVIPEGVTLDLNAKTFLAQAIVNNGVLVIYDSVTATTLVGNNIAGTIKFGSDVEVAPAYQFPKDTLLTITPPVEMGPAVIDVTVPEGKTLTNLIGAESKKVFNVTGDLLLGGYICHGTARGNSEINVNGNVRLATDLVIGIVNPDEKRDLDYSAGESILSVTGAIDGNGKKITLVPDAGIVRSGSKLDIAVFADVDGYEVEETQVSAGYEYKLVVKTVEPIEPSEDGEQTVEIKAASKDEAEQKAKAAIQAPEIEDVTIEPATYQSYFKTTATAKGDGTFDVKVELDPVVVTPAIATEAAAGEEPVKVEPNEKGETAVAAKVENVKPGLWYGYKVATELGGEGDTFANDVGSFQQAKSTGSLTLTSTPQTGKAAFFKIAVSPVKPKAE